MKLFDSFKTHEIDKTISPEETVDLVRRSLDNSGLRILERLVRIDNGRLDIPVYLSMCAPDAAKAIGIRKQMGKGAAPAQAMASALMELVERFSYFEFFKERGFKKAAFRDMGDQAIEYRFIPLSVHDPDPDSKAAFELFCDLPLEWSTGLDVRTGKEVLLPIDWFSSIHEYNGSAAGNSVEEALLQGICEVTERHVSSIISHEKFATPTIDPESIRDPVAKGLLQKFFQNDIKVYLKDFSLDTGIPTVGVLAYDPNTFPGSSEIVFTAGTATSPERAAIRALTEVAQLAGDFQNRTTYTPTLPKFTSFEESAYVTMASKTVPIQSLPDISDNNIKIEIMRCSDVLHKIGLDVFAVDMTHSRLKVPVVYAVIPGAHFIDRTRENDVCYHGARLASRLSDAQNAQKTLQGMLRLLPDRNEVWFFLGYTFERLNLPAEALRHFERAMSLNPRRVDIASIYSHIGIAYRDLGEYQRAIDILCLGLKHDADLKEIYQQLGFCSFKLKKHDEAIAYFEKVLEIDPGSAIDYANIGSNLRAKGHFAEAIKLYQMALELDPDIEFATRYLAELKLLDHRR
ncbi:MAG: YcaO-like family protein [Pseudomonadota bacterium]